MKNIFVIIFTTLQLVINNGQCQNLVPNSSFEDTLSCPNYLEQISNSLGWSTFALTPDYFNACNIDTTPSSVSVPWNAWGFQYPRTGNAYTGIVTSYIGAPNNNIREFEGVKLTQTLIIGQQYYASFYAVRAVSRNPYINVATNKLGLQFSTVPFSYVNPLSVNNRAAVYTDTIIVDTLNWTQVTGTFIADSAYEYLIIGNFFSDSMTMTIPFDTVSWLALYYIDDVEVELIKDSSNNIPSNNSGQFQIKIFPNPTKDWIVVEGMYTGTVSLYDILGKLCFTEDVSTQSSFRFNVASFSQGVYLMTVETSKEKIFKKIIIEH